MSLIYYRPCSRFIIVVVVVIIVTVLCSLVTGSASGGACSAVIEAYLEAAYKCTPDEFRQTRGCLSERLKLSCPRSKYLVIHSAQIDPTTNSECSSRFNESALHVPPDAIPTTVSASLTSAPSFEPAKKTKSAHVPQTDAGFQREPLCTTLQGLADAECSAVCVQQLFTNPCQGRRKCTVDTGSEEFRVVSTEACPTTEARSKFYVRIIYACVVKSIVRVLFSNNSHQSPSITADPCLSVTTETPSRPLHTRPASVTRKPSRHSRYSSSLSSEFSVAAMTTPAAAVAVAVEREDQSQSGPANDRMSEKLDSLSTQLVSRMVTSVSKTSSPSDIGLDEAGTLTEVSNHGFGGSLPTVVKATEDAITTPVVKAQLRWSNVWLYHLSSDWAWSYRFITENKEKFLLYLALAISIGFIFILFAIVLRLSFRKPLASYPNDSSAHRCRCSGSLSPKADSGGSSARQPLTMSCTSPITWRLPDIDPSIAGDERPGRGCEVQLTSFNRLSSLPRLRRDSIVDVPPPPSPLSPTADHVHEEAISDGPPVSSPSEAAVSTTATISRSHLNFIDNHSFGQQASRSLTTMVSRPLTTVVNQPLTTDAGGETSTAFPSTCGGNLTATESNTSSSSQFFELNQRDSSAAAKVSVRPITKFGSFGRTPGAIPCGQEYRELRQYSQTIQLPPGNHYFCT